MHKRGYVLLCLDNKTQSGSILELVNKLDSNIQKIYPDLSETMLSYLPPGTLVIKDSAGDKDTGYITLPVFSSIVSLSLTTNKSVFFDILLFTSTPNSSNFVLISLSLKPDNTTILSFNSDFFFLLDTFFILT